MSRPTATTPRSDTHKSLYDPFGAMDSSPLGGSFSGSGQLPAPMLNLELVKGSGGKPMVEKAAIDWSSGSYGGGYRQMAALAGDPTLTKPFLQNPWVFACIMAIARSGCVMPGALRKDDTEERIPKSLLLARLKRPNPLMSQLKLWRVVAIQQLLFGETFLVLLKSRKGPDGNVVMLPIEAGDVPDEIWPVPGPLVFEVLDEKTKLPKAWRIGSGTDNIEYPAHSVCQINDVDPHNLLRGIGPMQAAWRTAAKEFTLDRFDDAMLKNGGMLAGVLSVNGVLTPQMKTLMEQSWNANYSGADNARKTAVLPLGTKFDQFGFSPQEMEFADFRSWNRETVLSVFGVPRIILGLTDGVNYSGAVEARRIFYESTVIPLFEFIASEITYKLVWKTRGHEDAEFFFDSSRLAALREGADARVDRAIKLFNTGGRSFNDAARIAGLEILEPVAQGDRQFLPASMQALPEEKAKYDIEVARAKPAPSPAAGGGAQKEMDFDAAPAMDAAKASLEQRRAAEAQMAATLAPFEERVANKVKRVFRDYLLTVRKRLRSISGVEKDAAAEVQKVFLTDEEIEQLLAINATVYAEELRAAVLQPFSAMFDAAAKDAAAKAGSSVAFITHVNPDALDFLRSSGVNLAEGPLSTLARDVRATILRELATAPENVTSIADAVRLKLDELVDQVEVLIDRLPERAMNIARTESTSIYGYAHMRSYAESGKSMEWSTAGDEHVRDSHDSLNGQVRAPGEEFGFGLRFPGDPNAGAAQVVNCRCSLLPVMESSQ